MDVIKRKEIIENIKELSYYFDKCKDKLCEPYGLSSVQSKVILDVYHNEGTKITGICQRLNKETNTISPLINRLIKHEYLVKENDKNDRRVYYIYLSEKSKNIMENLVKEDADGPVHQWLDQLIVESGDELGVKKEAIEKAKARIAKRSKNNGELVNNE